MTEILLVRHGQSEWNALGRWQGQADPPLSDLGRDQAFVASRRLGTVDAIVSSDLQRAMHTAQIISGQLGVGPVIVMPELRERDAGEWSGLTTDEIDEQWPGYRASQRKPPGYEPDEQLLERVHEALDQIVVEYAGGQILVVAHGGIVYALEQLHGEDFERLPNLGARWLVHDDQRFRLGNRVVLVDDDQITTVPAQI